MLCPSLQIFFPAYSFESQSTKRERHWSGADPSIDEFIVQSSRHLPPSQAFLFQTENWPLTKPPQHLHNIRPGPTPSLNECPHPNQEEARTSILNRCPGCSNGQLDLGVHCRLLFLVMSSIWPFLPLMNALRSSPLP